MIRISRVYDTVPIKYKTVLQETIYKTLSYLNIPFTRVENTPAITMEDCVDINKVLDVNIVKTLLLCNRQKTDFYLFVTLANKKFSTKKFSEELNISRFSFAEDKFLDLLLGSVIGATTIFSVLIDKENKVNVVIDKDVLNEEYYGCTDGTTTGYIRIKTEDVIKIILPYSNHNYTVISM